MTKYKAKRKEFAGRSFGSKLEAAVYSNLLLLQKAGEIEEIQCQPRVDLVSGVKWFVDFKCTKPDESVYYVEAKGLEMSDYRIKKKLWKDFGPAKLEIWKGNHKKPFLSETIIPKVTAR